MLDLVDKSVAEEELFPFPPLELEPALGTGVLVIVTLTDLRSDTEDEEEEEGTTAEEVVAVLVSRTFVATLVTLSSRPLEVFPEELECFS